MPSECPPKSGVEVRAREPRKVPGHQRRPTIYKQPVALRRRDKTQNTGITSVDRSTKATLSTYNTWIQLSRLQKIDHPQSLKLQLVAKPLAAGSNSRTTGPKPIRCHVTMGMVDNAA